MNMPPKPELEHRQRMGQFGEIVEELTPESEVRWAEYLRQKRLAEIAIRRNDEATKDNYVERTPGIG